MIFKNQNLMRVILCLIFLISVQVSPLVHAQERIGDWVVETPMPPGRPGIHRESWYIKTNSGYLEAGLIHRKHHHEMSGAPLMVKAGKCIRIQHHGYTATCRCLLPSKIKCL
jgi:hypothetical protein